MGPIRKFFQLLANYFAFVGGLLFIFMLGIIYAYIKPQGILINGIFLFLGLGWIGFLIKYFWELVEKNEVSKKGDDDSMEIQIKDSSEATPQHSTKTTDNV